MKKALGIVGFLVLAAQLPLWSYDTSPSSWQIVPEAIWAPATGGGTWVTELQITNLGTSEIYVSAYFDTAAGSAPTAMQLGPIPVLNSVKYSNILATLDALDESATVYYGKVGALYLRNLTAGAAFQVQAQTVNGNFGKTFPGLNVVEGNTVGDGRPMMIQGLVRNATYRTFTGIYNPGTTSYTVKFTIVDATNATVGTPFEKTVSTYGFQSFNVFTQAAAPAGDYDNCWLYIEVTSGGSAAEAPMFFGSIANNYTNDTYALLAKQYLVIPPPASAPPIRH
ncbi:MAG: hypothetical protein OEW05_07340 [Candidatus Aminicenantes bacterium]|nr:hypothetical protein [Candidatus Aminicenantes bacterium]